MGRSEQVGGNSPKQGVIEEGSGSTLTALIVDDDEEIRHALRLLLDFDGIDVVGEAANGLEAVALAKQLQPRVIVLDYMMPRMNGEEAAQLIRAVVPNGKIIAFSAILEHEPAWADAFLNKDRISDIAPLIGRLIGLRAGAP